MRNSSTIATLGCLMIVAGVSGCHHTKTTQTHATVTEPVGMMVIREHPNGKPGVFMAVDSEASKSSTTAQAVTAPEVPKPLTTMKPDNKPALSIPASAVKPSALPDKLSGKPLPAENIFAPVVPPPAASTPKLPSTGILPVSGPGETKELKIGTPMAKNIEPVLPVLTIKETAPPAVVMPVITLVQQPAIATATNYSKGNIPGFTVNPKAGHSAEYEWVIGELCYSHAKKTWRVRYASLDSDDRYGGSVTLTGADRQLENMVNGQLVRIDGEVLEKSRTTAPRYHVMAMKPLE